MKLGIRICQTQVFSLWSIRRPYLCQPHARSMCLSGFVIVITFFGLTQNPAHPSHAVCVFTDAAIIPVFTGIFKLLQKTRTEPSAWVGISVQGAAKGRQWAL